MAISKAEGSFYFTYERTARPPDVLKSPLREFEISHFLKRRENFFFTGLLATSTSVFTSSGSHQAELLKG